MRARGDVCGRMGGGRRVVGEVVVVFDGLESRGFAVEAEVVDWDGAGKESFERFGVSAGC